MTISTPLSQYADIVRSAANEAKKATKNKLHKPFINLLVEILTLYMIMPRKINFTQMARYGTKGEQTYRNTFNKYRKDCIDWMVFN